MDRKGRKEQMVRQDGRYTVNCSYRGQQALDIANLRGHLAPSRFKVFRSRSPAARNIGDGAAMSMTAEKLREKRLLIGVSQNELGEMLSMGPTGGRTIRRWEAGTNPVPGPAATAIEALSSGWRPGDDSYATVKRMARRCVEDILNTARNSLKEMEEQAETSLGRII